MPLNTATLVTAILKRTDASRSDFVGWPSTSAAAAANWAGVAREYFQELVSPLVLPTAHPAGEAAFEAAMASVLASSPPGSPLGASALQAGFLAYATAGIAANVAPAPPGVATPPASALVVANAPTRDAAAAAATVAAQIDTWARTGLFTPVLGPAVPWS